MKQVALQSVIGKQIPEYIRSDYPLFVEFFQAYYEYLQNQNIDIAAIRDVDETLDSFIQYFRKELDVLGAQYPYIDQRLFLRNSKEWFTSKGAESSYKLLFKMYYGYDAEIKYPWDQVLKASNGEWKQDYSLFVNVTSGNAQDLVGNNINVIGDNVKIKVFCSYISPIQETSAAIPQQLQAGTTYTITSVGTTDFTTVGATDNLVGLQFVATGTTSGTGSVTYNTYTYEVFIDKSYYGDIQIGNQVELVQKVVTFDAILNVDITANTITIVDHGLSSGDNVTYYYTGGLAVGGLGTTASYYVIVVDQNTIKLAIDYKSAIDELAATTQLYNIKLSAPGIGVAHQLTKAVRGTILPTATSYKVSKAGSGFKIGSLVTGVTVSGGKVITQLLKVTRVDSNGGIIALDNIRFGYGYANDFFILAPSPNLTKVSSSTISATKGSTPQFSLPDDSVVNYYQDYGYIINPNYVDITYTDISYVATLINQFYSSLQTQLGTSVDFALISFKRSAVAKYPGHYSSNHGFLNDDIYIQDSYKYQKFSYVVSVGSMLKTYKSIVKAYLHPAGTALFGEYRIDNAYKFNIANSQVLGQWISQATYTNINKTIGNDYAYPASGYGWLRFDAYDSQQYVEATATDIYNPPLVSGKTQLIAGT